MSFDLTLLLQVFQGFSATRTEPIQLTGDQYSLKSRFQFSFSISTKLYFSLISICIQYWMDVFSSSFDIFLVSESYKTSSNNCLLFKCPYLLQKKIRKYMYEKGMNHSKFPYLGITTVKIVALSDLYILYINI